MNNNGIRFSVTNRYDPDIQLPYLVCYHIVQTNIGIFRKKRKFVLYYPVFGCEDGVWELDDTLFIIDHPVCVGG